MTLPTPGEIAGRATDPRFYASLSVLPNPDPILRKAGKSEEVFDSIQADAHVMGELRLVRADLLRFEHRLKAGGESRQEKRALELCQSYLERAPAPMTRWPDVTWNIGQAPFRGQSLHEIVWQRVGDQLMPEKLLDRPNRRFAWAPDATLRLLTREQPLYGVPAEEAYFLINRHMPSYDNPYGIALFSSCYWPWVFKHAGFKWIVKFCERLGIPVPWGTFPAGTPEPQIRQLEEALEALIEAGYVATQEGGNVTLLESKAAGSGSKLPQHLLVDAANAEMSKALSSQTLSLEQTAGNGARAASETHRDRAADVSESDRDGVAYTYDRLWALITLFNFGAGVKPPTSEFLAEEEVTKDRAEIYEIFDRVGGRPSRKAMAGELGIALADPADPEDQLQKPAAATVPNDPNADPDAEFARGDDLPPDQAALDAAIEQLVDGKAGDVLLPVLKPLLQLARDKPDELLGRLAELYPKMDSRKLYDKLTNAMFVAELWGQLSVQAED